MTVSSALALPPLADGVTLCGLGVDNLRALRMEQPVELRRLTLLAGRNGIGKSTFARVFPLLRQSAGRRTLEPLSWWEDDGVDFGSFSEAVHRGADEIALTFGFENTDGTRWRARSVLGRGTDSSQVRRMAIEEGELELSLNFDHDGRFLGIEDHIAGTTREASNLWLDWLPDDLRAQAGDLFTDIGDYVNPRLVLGDGRRYSVALLTTLQRLANANALVHEIAMRTVYLGPFRDTPKRSYRPRKLAFDRGLDPMGADLAMFLVALSDDERRDLNAELHARFGFEVTIQSAGGLYSVHVVLADDTYNLMDVGYGYSQVLPVAVQLWASRRTLSTSRDREPHAVVVIEQPELHLHPHQQALLGRALGSFAADEHGPMHIIETHSDHLISEIGMMVALGQLSPERVGVLCFEPHPEGGTRVFNAHFNEDGVLHDWPVGFLSP